MNNANIGPARSSRTMTERSNYLSTLRKALIVGGVSLTLAACGGGESTDSPNVALVGAGGKPKALISGQSLIGLGSLSAANLATFEANGNGVVSPTAEAVSTSETGIDGEFEILVPLDHSGLQITSFGGSYIDRTDQNPDGESRRQFSLGSTDAAIQAWLPAGEEVVVLNLFTEALYIKSLGEASGGNFDQVFQINREKAAEAMGFDIVSTVPSLPVAPAAGDLTASKQYGMLLGGLGNAVNAVSVKLGLVAPNVDVLRAVAIDLVDGELDGTIRGVPVTTPAGNLPTDIDLESEVIRFRNNNFRSYEAVPVAEMDSETLGEPTAIENAAPTAVNDAGFVAFRGVTNTVSAENGVLQNDSDPEGNDLFAAIQSQPQGGTVELASDGGFSLVLDSDNLGLQTFSYVANDLDLDSEPATVSFNVENLPPNVEDDDVTVFEGSTVSISVLANDTDDVEGLVIASVDEAERGELSIVSGRIQYAHDGSSAALDSFGYSVVDVDGATGFGTVTVTISFVNDAPQVSNPFSTVTATEEQLLDFVFADDVFSDDEGDTLSFSALQSGGQPLPAWLSFIPSQRRFSGIPDEPDLQNLNIDLTADDGNGGTAVNPFVLQVITVNDAPNVDPIADQSGTEDQATAPIAITFSDVDSNLASLTVAVDSNNPTLLPAAGFSVSGLNGSRDLVISPAADQSGTALVSVTVSDGDKSATESFTLTIAEVNDLPVISDIADINTTEDSAVPPIGFTVSDVESLESLVITAISDNQTLLSNADIVISGSGENRTVTVSPNSDQFGIANVTVTVDDGTDTASDSFAVDVASVNDEPAITAIADQETDEDQAVGPVAFTVSDIETADTDLTVTAVSDNPILIASADIVIGGSAGNRNVSYQPQPNQSGSSVITVTVSDGDLTAAVTFTATVLEINDAPTFSLDGNDETVSEDAGTQTVAGKVESSDAGPNESSQTVSFNVSNNNNGLFSIQPVISSAGELSYTPASDANGSATVTVVAQDDGNPVETSAAQTFTITVSPSNDAPEFSLDGSDVTVNEDSGSHTFAGKVEDAQPGGGDDEVEQAVSFVVSNDNNGLFSSQPTIDSNGDLRFSTSFNSNGSATVTVVAQDDGTPSASSPSQTFEITVSPVNDTPSFILDGNNETTTEDSGAQTVAGKVASSSAGGGADEVEQVVTFVVSNNNGSLFSVQPQIDTSGVLRYTPAADQAGSAIVTVQAQDDGSPRESSPAQTFSISVTAVNDAPSFVLDGNDEQILEDAGNQVVSSKATSISPGPANESGQSVSFTLSNDNNALFLVQPTMNASGSLSYIPANDASGSAVVNVVANDSGFPGASSAPQTFTIVVSPVNDAPSLTVSGNVSSAEDFGAESFSGQVTGVSAGPVDESEQNVTLNVTNDNNALFSVQPAIDAAGTLSYVAAADATGSAIVSVVAQDDGGIAFGGVDTSVAETFTITITPVNDAPSFVLGGNVSSPEDSGTEIIGNQVTSLVAGPADEASQTVTLNVTNDNNSLFSSQPIINSAGALIFVAAPDAIGSAVVSVVAQDDGGTAAGGIDTSAAQTFTITITPVNDAPSFVLGGNVSSPEDSGTEIIGSQVTAISAGPADEASQNVTLNVTNDNNSLFSSQPIIDSAGALIFVAAPDAIGSAVVSVVAQDDGGTAFGGVDTSAGQTFTITITPVNDAPSFVLGGNVSSPEDSGTEIIGSQVTAISAGPADEAGQTVTLNVTNNNNSLFSSQPIIDSSGALIFVATPDAIGTAVVSVAAQDDGGTAFGGVDTSAAQTFTITITPVNDAPSFVLGSNVSSPEDSGTEIIGNQVTSLVAGPADEASQNVTLNVTNDNNSLFSSQPIIDSSGALIFVAAPDANGSAIVSVVAQDNGGTAAGGSDTSVAQTFTLTVTPVNDAPIVDVNTGVTVDEGAISTILPASLSASDIDNSAAELSFIVRSLPSNGAVRLNGVALARDAGFTMSDVNGGLVDYQHFGGENTADNFVFDLNDTGGAGPQGQTVNITVNPVNDAPVLVTNDLLTVNEGSSATLSNVFLVASDVDNALTDVRFTVTTLPINGELLLNGVPVSVNGSFSMADVDSARVSYNHFGDENLADIFLFDLSDIDGDGPNGEVFNITVNPVNDAPSFTLGGNESSAEDAGLQTVAGKASNINSGPSGEAAQNVSFIVSNDNNSLFSQQPAIDASGQLSYTAAADANGSAIVTVSAQDDGGTDSGGVDTSATQTFDISITPVNDTPSFTLGTDETVLEDAAAQSIATKATAISAGPADESTQTLNFIVSNDNNALFSVQPAMNAAGTLSFTSAADANGTATVSVQLQDNGTPAESSAIQTLDITVTAVNDAPSFTVGANQLVNDGSGAHVVGAHSVVIDAGPADEAGQTVSFVVSNNNNAIFSDQPAIDGNGDLSFEVLAPGQAIVSVTAIDDGGTANSGVDTSAAQVFTITVNALPGIDVNTGVDVSLNGAALVTSSNLAGSDPEDGSNVTYAVDSAICGGFEINGTPTNSFSQFDLDGANITFVQGGCAAGSVQNESLRVIDQDGAETSFTFEVRVISINVDSSNVAPNETANSVFSGAILSFVDENGNAPSLEGDSVPSGVLVQSSFGSAVTISDMGSDLLVDPSTAFFAGELVRVHVNPSLTDTRGASALPFVTEFHAAVTGTGDGTFNPHPVASGFAAGGSGAAVEFGDVDGDGDLDAVLADDPALQTNAVWLNDGFGVFTPHATFTNFGAEYFDVALADIDNDGSLDAILSHGSAVDVFLNDGTGDFTTAGSSLSVTNGFPVRVADLTGDGALDLVVGQQGTNDGRVFENDGAGNLAPHSTPTFGVNRAVRDIASGDFDSDGDIDLFITSTDQQNIWRNDGRGVFTRVFITSGNDDMRAAPFDVDRDGDLDIVLRRGVGGADTVQDIVVMRNDGSGTFALEAEQNFPSLGLDHNYIDWGDLDGDGDIDLISGRTSNAAVFINDGNGTFSLTSQNQIATAGAGRGLDLADVDGDGDLDFIQSPLGSGAIEVWTNNQPPVASLNNNSIDENQANSSVGELSATLESGETDNYSLVAGAGDDDNGLFEVFLSSVWELLVGQTPLNFENKSSYSIRLEVTDGAGGVSQQVFTILANDVNEAPVITQLAGITVDEGGSGTIDNTLLQVVDVDAAHGPQQVQYTLTTATSQGVLRRGGVVLNVTDTFTQNDIDNNLLSYEHGGGETVADVFSFSATDPEGLGVTGINFNITVNPINDAPVITVNNGLTLDEGGSEPIGAGLLAATDEDNLNSELIFTITTAPLNGEVQINETGIGVNDTFTMADVVNSTVGYSHFGGESASDSFGFSLLDTDGAGPTNQTFSITVSPVNDAPVLDTNLGLTLDEDGTAAISNAVLAASDADHVLDDVNFTLESAPTSGEIQRSGVPLETNGVFSMQDVVDGLVSYVHLGDENVSDGFNFSVTDPDGDGPINQIFSISISPINDAPSVTLGLSSVQTSFESLIDLTSLVGLGSTTFEDADAGANDVQVTITADSAIDIIVDDAELLAGKVTNNSTSVVSITASVADINDAISTPFGIAVGIDGLGTFNLAFVISDLGNSGAGGAQTDSATLEVQVNSIALESLGGVGGITLQDASAGIQLGAAVTEIGDINADGFVDYAVAASRFNSDSGNSADLNSDGILDGSLNGAVYVVYGNAGISDGFDLSTLNGTNGFVILGADGTGTSGLVDTGLGEAISEAGDFNGDGVVDLLIGAPQSDSGTGRAYLVLGEAGRTVASIDLSNFDDSAWIVFDASFIGGRIGSALASGDFNSDGIDDVIIGAPGINTDTGAVFMKFGNGSFGVGSGQSTVDLATLSNDVTDGIRFDGNAAGDLVGQSLATGDIFGGGVSSLVIGSTMQASGGLGGFFAVKGERAYSGPTALEALPQGVGTQITGDISNNLGISVDVVDDMNGDGFADIVVGGRDLTVDGQENAGWIVPGFSTTPPAADVTISDLSLNSVRLLGVSDGDLTGYQVASAGDYNSDGLGDLVIAVAGVGSETGVAYVLFGSLSLAGTVDLSTLDGTNGLIYLGVDPGDQTDQNADLLGMAVSAAGDVNGDGFDDILIGARQASHLTGAASGNAYLAFGSSAGNSLSIVDATINAGGAGDELILGGQGNNTLDGGAGNDILIAGPAADVLVYDTDDITRVDGGSGDDILQVPDFGSSHTQDFASIQQLGFYNLFQNIESIELPDANRNDIYIFDHAAIRHMTDERNTLRVHGEITLPTEPRIRTVDFWLEGPEVTEGSIIYDTYLSTDSEVRLFVDQRLDNEVLVTILAKRVSEATAGDEADGASSNAKLSGNGQFVVYQSTASNLDASVSTTAGRQHIYRTDLLTDETIMVSQFAGSEGDDFSYDPCISYDGSTISFATNADNLVGTVVEEQLLVNIVASTVQAPISLNPGANATAECDISADGNFVGYYSDDEVVRYDIANDQNAVISIDMAATDICSSVELCGGIALSGDGNLAVFSTPVLLSSLGDGNSGHDIVLADMSNGQRTLVTAGKNGQSARADISSSGDRIVFESDASNVTGFDSNGVPDIFIYDVSNDIFGRASTNDTGGATSVPTGITVAGEPDGAGDPVISGDGEFFAWLGNQVGFSLSDSNVSVYLKHVSGAINNSVLVGEAYRYHLAELSELFAAPSDRVSIDFFGQHFAFQNPANNVARGAVHQIVDTNGVDDIFAAENPIYVVNLTANSDGDALSDNTEVAFGTNPGATDSDGDGLSDFDEVNRDGDPTTFTVAAGGDSSPLNPDTDGDDLSDGIEALYLSDPSNANVVLHVSQATGSDANDGLTWASALQSNTGVSTNAAYSAGGADPANAVIIMYDPGVYGVLPAGGDNLILIGGMGVGRIEPFSFTASVIESSGAATIPLKIASQTNVVVDSLSFRHAGGSSGRAITVFASNGVEIRNSVLFEIVAGSGGGVLVNGSTAAFDNVVFESNRSAIGTGGSSNGGAIEATSSSITVNKSRFADNVAEGSGTADTGNGGAISVDTFSSLQVFDSEFIANQTTSSGEADLGGGGAISVASGSTVFVGDSRFIGNTAEGWGGAIRFTDEGGSGGQLDLFNNLFAANLALQPSAEVSTQGGAVVSIDSLAADIQFNTVVFNQADPFGSADGSGIAFLDSGSFNPPNTPPAIYNLSQNIIRDNYDSTQNSENDNVDLDSTISAAAMDRQFNNVEFNVDAEDIDVDPIFSNGYYLGNQGSNLSVDVGGITAAAAGLTAPFTTRVDGVGDVGVVDLGFHYQNGNQQAAFDAVASPGTGGCVGLVVQQFSIDDFDGNPIGDPRSVVVEVASAAPGLGNVFLNGVGSLEPLGAGSALLRPLSNGNYELVIQTDSPIQTGDLILDVYVDDLTTPITAVTIAYPSSCS